MPWSPALMNGMNALPFVKASLILLRAIFQDIDAVAEIEGLFDTMRDDQGC